MKILFVVTRPLEINTSASIRNIATLYGLKKNGHKVTILTTEPNKTHSNYDPSIFDSQDFYCIYVKYGLNQLISSINQSNKILQYIKKRSIRVINNFRVYDAFSNNREFLGKLSIIINEYDLIISSSDPKSSHLYVERLFSKTKIKIPWIQIWGDPFFGDVSNRSFFKNKKIKREENRLLRYATKVVYVSKITLKEQKVTYPNFSDKMYYLPSPYMKKIIYNNVFNKEKKLTFLYAGDYNSKIRDIKNLYNSFLNSEHNLIICGNSDIKLESKKNIDVYSRLSYEKVYELETKSDVLIHLSNIKGSQIPGKIYQYLGTNKPILFVLDGKTNMIKKQFEKYNRFIFTENNTIDISEKVNEVYSRIEKLKLFPAYDLDPVEISQKILEGIH